MKNVHLLASSKLHLYLLNFQNINMYAKGHYRIKIEAETDTKTCLLQSPSPHYRSSELGKRKNQQYFTKEFSIRYQNQKIEVNQLCLIESPIAKYTKNNQITIKFTLLKAEKDQNRQQSGQYLPLRSSYIIVRCILNTVCEYIQCTFQDPFLSVISAIALVQPFCVSLESKQYKSLDVESPFELKKEVKRLRYNSFLLSNKMKKIFYSDFQIEFTLPKIFVTQEVSMQEIPANQQMFLNYLIQYQQMKLTPKMIIQQLLSICSKNDELFKIFDDNCTKNTVFTSKLKMEFQEKEKRRYKLYIVKEEYKDRYFEEYKPILKEKLKILNKQMEIGYQDEVINNIICKIESVFEEIKPSQLPTYPFIIQETQHFQSIKSDQQDQAQKDDDKTSSKIRYLLILAHGYQGSPEDLSMLANGFKKKYKKTKYVILNSFKNKMGESLETMADLAAEEINSYLSCIDFKDKIYKIVMIGHSMGGLVLRMAANKIKLKELLYAFISLGTPHLGYLQGLRLHIRAGLSLFSNLYSNPCLHELSGKDSEQLHESSIYRMSMSGSLSNFTKVILVASNRDKYVSWHSARIQNYNKDILKQHTFIENEMIHNILKKGSKIERIDRLEVNFNCLESNMDKIIGRTCHIKMLTDCSFIQLLCSSCIPHIFES